MNLSAQKTGTTLRLKISEPRIEGDNSLVSFLNAGKYISSDLEVLELDLADVEYINSPGISELINLNRNLQEATNERARMVFLNVDQRVNSILELVEVTKIAEIHVKD